MARVSSCSWLLLHSVAVAISVSVLLLAIHAEPQDDRKTYIVYMGDQPRGEVSMSMIHMGLLQKVVGSHRAPEALLHSFKRSFNGFVVKLTAEEMLKIAGMEGVVSVFPNEKKQLHTTRSWDFMGFSQQVKRTTTESDIIIGVLDSGIWAESNSFNDSGFGPPPTKWKGACHNITCNNKIIGAKYYRSDGVFSSDDFISPRDSDGHGTHIASTVAGGLVTSASLLGLGSGNARGGVPSARIAVYKVCWSDGCHDADILAAFDDAIADGVDIISLSIGGNTPRRYFNDSIAIGSFHAMKFGILTSTSAGNSGPNLQTITNFSPWSLSVAASIIDRKFFTKVQLGNNLIYEGVSINTFDLSSNMYPMIYGGDAPNITGGFKLCLENSLDQDLVKGKIVLCDGNQVAKKVAFASGAAGVIMHTPGIRAASSFALSASLITTEDANNIYSYMTTTSNPNATILKSNIGEDTRAPYVAPFSSRGPNSATFDILKPDIAAPGVEILAAWSPTAPPSRVNGDNRQVQYNIISGTSMACPHVTAAAAYIKSFHPTWSPAAIQSSLMTTAVPMSAVANPEAEFAYGSGHINPIKALNPGLVYDSSEIDYVKFLCGQGYDTRLLQLVTGDNSSCSEANNGTVWDLNYPSFAVSTFSSIPITPRVFTRAVTNVGSTTSIYKAIVTAPTGLEIKVNPSNLSFNSIGQKLSFELSVEGSIGSSIVSASLVWDDGSFQVRSPIVVFLLL
ncbi:Cucumisin [Quillaja saponaria]|uniref:Cucumisin n=1 Tax=Quillaja saponaria TaxID=32244 RepID=A0AAD7LWB6_QUISA|nr:Cucumisin [Quillaja saponaria]